MSVSSRTLQQITKAYQLIRCEEMLRAAQSLVRLYGQMKRLEGPAERPLDPAYFATQQDDLGEDIQLIQYQLFVLGWTGKSGPSPFPRTKTSDSRIAYALCLSRLVGQEGLLQKTTHDCLRMAKNAGYSVLEIHLTRILSASKTRSETLLSSASQQAA